MEPHSTVSGAIAGAAVSMPILLMGAQLDALVIGLIAAIVISIMTEAIDNWMKAGAAVLFSSLSAGYGSPLAAQWVSSNYPSIVVDSTHDVLRMALALVIGAAMPSIVPIAIRFMNRKSDAL